MRLLSTGLLALLLLAGCAHTTGGVAPSNVPIEPGSYRIVKDRVAGRDCLVNLFGILPLSGGNKTANAVDAALRSAPGATALINITADTYSQFWILWTQTCTTVRATAVAPN